MPRTGKPPCRSCPKKSPEEAQLYELSPRNLRALEFYNITRAMMGTNLTEAMRGDAILQKNMAIIDQIIRPFEAESASASAVAAMFEGMALPAGAANVPMPPTRGARR